MIYVLYFEITGYFQEKSKNRFKDKEMSNRVQYLVMQQAKYFSELFVIGAYGMQ